ncbi:unnamed protein product [Meganyctiphanes norvegica]|uniref:Peptidase S1 domain-containing protein n=1 Tax=Meganyctiphanes norvegica TaxID=48144 RepID=A0AAV2PKT4_MEGNR
MDIPTEKITFLMLHRRLLYIIILLVNCNRLVHGDESRDTGQCLDNYDGPDDNTELHSFDGELAEHIQKDEYEDISRTYFIDGNDELDEGNGKQTNKNYVQATFLSKLGRVLDVIYNGLHNTNESRAPNIHISFDTIYVNEVPVPEIEPPIESHRKDTPVKPVFRQSLQIQCPKCGIAKADSKVHGGPSVRIAGGQIISKPHKYPWLVSIRTHFPNGRSQICGGSIINKRYVLTAAHCLYSADGTCLSGIQTKVRVGSHNFKMLYPIKGVTREIKVKEFIKHPRFICPNEIKETPLGYIWGNETFKQRPPIANNDIALARLEEDLNLNDPLQQTGIRPICLPTDPSELYDNTMGIAAGWGWRSPIPIKNGSYPERWYKVQILPSEVSVEIDNHHCDAHEAWIIDKNNMICAGKDEGGKDACSGDSGGPLVVKKDDRYVLVGITSLGKKGGTCQGAGIYTRVTAYLDWIKENTKDVLQCSFMT